MTIKMSSKIIIIGVLCILLGGSLSYANPRQWIVTSKQAQNAFDYAMNYVDQSVAYRLGGRLTVEEYSQKLSQGKQPGTEIGVDSSAVVRNAYRRQISDMYFFTDQNMQRRAREVSSSALYHYNTRQLTIDEIEKGDLIFFKNDSGNITGVAMFSHIQGNVIHFIVASANAGQVVLTNVDMNGNYWRTRFAGFGRLQYTLSL